MNLVTSVVVKVLKKYSRTTYGNKFYVVEVEANCYGVIEEKILVFNSREERDKVDIGYEFES